MKNKTLLVKKINTVEEANLSHVAHLLSEMTEEQAIDLLNWPDYDYQPEVKFRIAHCQNQLWLQFTVKEKHILAKTTETNGPVHLDSCVEFFFDPKGDGNYYNFEFNCIGITHLAYGPDRGNRQVIDPQIIESKIQVQTSLTKKPQNQKGKDLTWEITLIIPTDVLIHDTSLKLSGLKSKANFYKCGDDTISTHFLTWNPVKTTEPDYHRPEYFGNLIFE